MNRTPEMIEQRRRLILDQASELEAAGVTMLDLTGVTHDLYGEVARSVKIPVLGGQAGAEADGRIVGFTPRVNALDRPDDGRPNSARYIYDAVVAAVEATREQNF